MHVTFVFGALSLPGAVDRHLSEIGGLFVRFSNIAYGIEDANHGRLSYSTWEAAMRKHLLESSADETLRPRLFGTAMERKRCLRRFARHFAFPANPAFSLPLALAPGLSL
jgi:hypothetical protein